MKAISILTKILATFVMLGCFTQHAFAANAMHIVINNHLGAPEMLIDENRHVVWQAEYDEFGKATILVEEVEFNHRLPGQYYDKETGLLYNYYRDYDPALGRYVQSDPRGVLLDYSDPQRQVAAQMGVAIPQNNQLGYLNHGYGYANQNPVNYIDPTGETVVAVVPVALLGLGVLGISCALTGTCDDVMQICGEIILEMAKDTKKTGKEKASNIPSYAQGKQKGPDQNCHEFALSILEAQFSKDDPRYWDRGARSAYSQIKKNCERK